MDIETGDRLAFELESDGRPRVSRVEDEPRPLRGLLAEYAQGGSLENLQVRAALRRRAAARHARLARTVRRRSGIRSS